MLDLLLPEIQNITYKKKGNCILSTNKIYLQQLWQQISFQSLDFIARNIKGEKLLKLLQETIYIVAHEVNGIVLKQADRNSIHWLLFCCMWDELRLQFCSQNAIRAAEIELLSSKRKRWHAEKQGQILYNKSMVQLLGLLTTENSERIPDKTSLWKVFRFAFKLMIRALNVSFLNE